MKKPDMQSLCHFLLPFQAGSDTAPSKPNPIPAEFYLIDY